MELGSLNAVFSLFPCVGTLIMCRKWERILLVTSKFLHWAKLVFLLCKIKGLGQMVLILNLGT